MADNLKPYNPNKSWIEFRLNPDVIIDELGNLIPYRNTIGMIDSEAPWSEVGKSALRETPVLGSILEGKPANAIEEAFLFANPIKGSRAKAALNKEFKPGTQFGMYGGESYGEPLVVAKSPRAKKYLVFSIGDNGSLIAEAEGPAKDFNKVIKDKPTDINGLFNYIDNTNAAFDKVPLLKPINNIKLANEDIGMPLSSHNPPEFTPGFGGKFNSLGNKIEEYSKIKQELDKANNVKLKEGESIKVLIDKEGYNDPSIVKVDPSKKWYTEIGGRIGDYWKGIPSDAVLGDLPDKNLFNADYKDLQNNIKKRNIKADFEDDVIPYNNHEQYSKDYNKAYNEYSDALYGPFIEDIIPNSERYKI
jgi:hypothetical protein